MNRLQYSFFIVWLFLASCTKDFAEINSNPQVMDIPKPEYLFARVTNSLQDGCTNPSNSIFAGVS